MTATDAAPLLLAALAGYFCGSIPFPYIAVRLKTGRDLRDVHTGNVGVMNSMSVLGRWLGLVVFAVEIIKGLTGTWIGLTLAGDAGAWIALLAAVIGANWSIWIAFAGGRGNTSFSGGLALIGPPILVALLLMFVVGRAVLGSAFIAARLNMVLMPALFGLFGWWRYDDPVTTALFAALGVAFALIFRVKHSRATDDHIALNKAGRLPGGSHNE